VDKPIAGDQQVLTIEAMGDQGDGLACGGVVVPLGLPGERVLASVAGGRGEILEILQPSGERVAPPCPHFGDCGGCALQHWATSPYLAWKVERIRQALARQGIETKILAAAVAPPAARRRLALHARRHGREVALGLKARRSWRVVDLQTCTIAQPGLVAALPALRRIAGPLLEHPRSAPTLHVTATDTGLDVEISGIERSGGGLSASARQAVARAAEAADMARVCLGGEIVYQSRPALVRLGLAVVALPPGAFLQAAAAAEAAMAAFIVQAASGARAIADLYCGVGTFTFPLAAVAPVMAADVSAAAVAALRAAIASAPGLRAIAAEVRDLDRRPVLARELARFDVVVFDPPRAGAVAQTAQIAASSLARAIAVSCNVQTFARDARTLVDAGFTLQRVLPVDQFLWSSHIELVGLFSRERP
jgi:23S rRNA (uracil1939-C5)-methyltransferase